MNSHSLKHSNVAYLVLTLLFLFSNSSLAQTATTIREINAIPEENIALLEAGGATLDRTTILANIFNDFEGQEVEIIAVILSDPRNSGLANVDQDGRVDRIHMFVRDTSAVSLGVEGMGIQVVDANYEENELLSLGVGDIVKIIGTVSPFGTVMQLAPTSIELIGLYDDFGLPVSLLDPVPVTSDQVNSLVGENGVQVNWSNLADLRGQFVRLNNVEIVEQDLTNSDRPDFYVSSDSGATIVNFYDIGVQFRNDRDDYPQDFNIPFDSDFIPPLLQSIVDIQGFLTLQNGADQIGRAVPDNALLSISPFERRTCPDGFDCDLAIAVTPPIVSDIFPLDIIPDGTESVQLTFDAQADPLRSLDSGFCEYTTSMDSVLQSVDASLLDSQLTCTIPPQPDTTLISVRARVSDNAGATNFSEEFVYVTLADGINDIADIQRTLQTGPESSPLAGNTWPMDITATVTSQPEISGFYVVQDDEDLGPWSGILIESLSSDLQLGDQIHITSAEIAEFSSITTLFNPTYTVQSSGNAVRYKPITTTELLDPFVAEAHESMMLRFVDIIMGPNPDFLSNFGEWTFTTQGEDFVRADDRSDAFSSDFNTSLIEGSTWDFIQGIWWYSFGYYKLIPESPTADLIPAGSAAAPTFTATPETGATVCSTYTSTTMAMGTPRPNFSLIDPPEGMTITGLGGDIEWFPSAPGTYEISIEADNDLFTEIQTFSLEVDSIRAALSIDQGFGDIDTISSYRLISLPGTSRLPVASTFSGTFGEDWFLFRDNGQLSANSDVYLEADDGTFTFNAGQGFWALSQSNWQLSPTQTALPIEQACSHVIELQEGWNIIGNPFTHEVSWNDVQHLSNSQHVLWSVEDGTSQWKADSILTPYEGYYVFSDAPSSLTIPFLDIESPAVPDESEYLELIALAVDDTVSTARILFSEEASLSLDSLDQFAPRNAFQLVSTHFLLDEDENKALFTESRPYLVEGQRLLFSLINNSEEQVLLQLGENNLPFDTAVLLINQEQGFVFNLNDATKIPHEPGSSRIYSLIIGDNPTASSVDQDLLPSETTLSQNFPNPFNKETTIAYTLTDAEWVRIEIYDVLGRKVDTLVDAFQVGGTHEVVWQGADGLASGVYVYQLKTENSVLSRTLLISR